MNNGTQESIFTAPEGNASSGMMGAGGLGVQNAPPVTKLPKNAWIAIAAAAMLLIAAVFIAVVFIALNAKPTINLNKYLTIEAEGYDGYGRVKASIDWDAIKKKYGKKVVYTKQASKEYAGLLSFLEPMEVVQGNVNVKFDNNGKLSNDDTVHYTWEIDQELSKYIKVKLKYEDAEHKVSGLAEVGTFDAFADVTLTYEGYAPRGTARIEYRGSELSSYDFICDKDSGLRNGDTVTVMLNTADMESFAQNLGKIPSTTEKKFTVSGLAEYVSSYADLTEDFIKKLHAEAEDEIYARTAKEYNAKTSLSDLKYSGYIITSVKDSNEYSNSLYELVNNEIYIIYSGTVSHTDGDFATAEVYYPVRFINILKDDSGLNYEQKDGITGYSELDGGWYRTMGYVNPLLCYQEIVEKNRDSYTAESGDGFEAYQNRADVAELTDISEAYLTELSNDAKSRIESYVADDFDYRESSIADLALLGEYLLVAKSQGTDYASNNKLVLVYSAVVTNSQKRFQTTTVYYPVEYDGIVALPGEKYMVTSTQGILGYSTFQNSWSRTKGYVDGAEMFSEIITTNRNNYNYEVSEGLKAFGE